MKNFIQKAVSNKFFEITRTLIKSRDIIKSKEIEIDNKEFIKEIAKNITAPENLELFEVALKYEGYPINFETTINSQGIIENCNILGDMRVSESLCKLFLLINFILNYFYNLHKLPDTLIFLALTNASKKWTIPIKNWAMALNQFAILCDTNLQNWANGEIILTQKI